ncbi:hypothetical protein Dimus_017011 [Dionaea muscipula]
MMDSSSSSSFASRFDHQAYDSFETCKDVDVVSGCSTSTTIDSQMLPAEERRMELPLFVPSTISLSQEEYDVDNAHGIGFGGHANAMSLLSSLFEFQNAAAAERASQRVPLPLAVAPPPGPFSKPVPSKWDDAQKWISSPNSNISKIVIPQGQGQGQGQGEQAQAGRKAGSNFPRWLSSANVVQVLDQRSAACDDEPYTKRIDSSQVNKEKAGVNAFVSWDTTLPYTLPDSYAKQAVVIGKSLGQPAVSLSQHDSSLSIQTAKAFVPPPSTARSVSMRDMGTEMTPIASQEPSRIGTPVKDMSPIRSPISSRPSSPKRVPPPVAVLDPAINLLDMNREELSQKEIQMRTRKEIMLLGTKLGKMSIAAWASQEDDKDASSSVKNVTVEQPPKTMLEARAEAWEEAEKTKYMARFEREEMKIQAWENHQKAKMETKMRKIEVEVERIRAKEQDRLMSKLAAARHTAEEKRAAAETKREKQVAKAQQQADYIRKTGRIPSKFACCNCCFCFCCY